jgi:hypothetical protein
MRVPMIVVLVMTFVNFTIAFKAHRVLGFRATSSLSANKLDGIMIAGDLTPIANNLLIRVKEAATSTTGGRKFSALFLVFEIHLISKLSHSPP